MINFTIFMEQNDKKDISKREMFYYLLKNRYKNPRMELKKFTMDECCDGKTFLKYDLSTFKKNVKINLFQF